MLALSIFVIILGLASYLYVDAMLVTKGGASIVKINKLIVKKVTCILLILITLAYVLSAYFATISVAKEKYAADLPELKMSIKEVENRLKKLITHSIGTSNESTSQSLPPTLSASRCIVSDLTTDRILFEKNAYSKTPMASTTKIMTFIVAIENCDDIYETVTVSRAAAYTEGSTMHLAEGETITVHDLLYGLLLNSGNDAAVAIAEHIGGTAEDFCVMMNDRAAKIGASNTNFKTPHGLDREGHYTTAYELALIAKEAYKQPLFRKIISTSSITLSGHYLRNTNPLLGVHSEVTGGKTGYTSGAGKCIVFFIETVNVNAVAVLLNCPTSNDRVSDSRKLINYTGANFKTYELFTRGTRIDYFKVEKGRSNELYGIIDNNVYITLAKWENSSFSVKYTRKSNFLTAPVAYLDVLGKINITFENASDLPIEINVTSEGSVVRKTYTDHLSDMINTLPYIFG